MLGYLLYTKELTISLPLKKVRLQKAKALILSTLAKTLLLLVEARTLARQDGAVRYL